MSAFVETLRRLFGVKPDDYPRDLPENLPDNSRLIRAVELQRKKIERASQSAQDEAHARQYFK